MCRSRTCDRLLLLASIHACRFPCSVEPTTCCNYQYAGSVYATSRPNVKIVYCASFAQAYISLLLSAFDMYVYSFTSIPPASIKHTLRQALVLFNAHPPLSIMLPIISTVGLGLVILYFVKSIKTYRQLHKFGGYWFAGWSRLWLLRVYQSGKMHITFTEVNEKYGACSEFGETMMSPLKLSHRSIRLHCV